MIPPTASSLVAHQELIRLGFFLGILAIMAAWEILGISTFRQNRLCTWLPGVLLMPFIGKVPDYALNRRSWGAQP